MAAIKRKSEPQSQPNLKKKTNHTSSEPPAKRQRKETSSKTSTKPKKVDSDQKALPKISLLQDDERAFPRGGASVLTPYEQKQIQVQATRDALFEEATGKERNITALDSDTEQAEKSNAADSGKNLIVQKKRKKSTQQKFDKSATKAETKQPSRAEGLKPKRMIPGTLVLGQVSHITSNDLVLDLPNNITGFVPITAISSQLNNRLQDLLNEDEDEEESETEDAPANGNIPSSGKEVNLRTLFKVGQYLRASVQASSDEASHAKSKRINLSLMPQAVNSGLAADQLPVHSAVQAAVVSVEDHGLVMDLGLEDKAVRGFISSKQTPEGMAYEDIEVGTVFLCFVTGLGSNGRVVKLSANHKQVADVRKGNIIADSSTIDPFLPGSAVEMLITRTSSTSIFGQILGTLDASADLIHSGAGAFKVAIESKYPAATKVKARVIFSTPDTSSRRIGVSLLDHIMNLSVRQARKDGQDISPLEALPISTTVKASKIVNVEPTLGAFVDVGIKGISSFVHLSRLTDDRIETLSADTGPYKIGASHPSRIVGYNGVDGLYLASMQASILAQPFLRPEDVPVGAVVKAKIEKIVIGPNGVSGLMLDLAQGVSGFVHASHLSDVQLQHPERKFKEGLSVTARVLTVDPEKRQVRLTLKKTLVNSDLSPWVDYAMIKVGSRSVGTITKFRKGGAVVQFYGVVKAFLPTSEMSDAFIQDPTQHFRLGQTVSVHALEVNAGSKRMIVSCKGDSANNAAIHEAFTALQVGRVVSGTIVEKTEDNIAVNLQSLGLKATLSVGQMSDGSQQKTEASMKRLRVGQTLQDLVVLEKFDKKHSVVLTNKPSLVNAAKAQTLLCEFSQVKARQQYDGFVRNITESAIFVGFGNGLTGLLPKALVSEELSKLPSLGLFQDKSLSVNVLSVDHTQRRFVLTMKPIDSSAKRKTDVEASEPVQEPIVMNPVDKTSLNLSDFAAGTITKAKVTSVKETQLNMQLADNVQGRIDISEVFSSLEDVKDRKQPLRSFKRDDILDVRVLGIHDARNHRFLPISHRAGRVPVFELSRKLNESDSVSTMSQLERGSVHVGFVNNISAGGLWVNLSPNVRGRIGRMDVSEDVSILNDLESRFALGSALQVYVKNVDMEKERLDLSTKPPGSKTEHSLDTISPGMILAGRITKTTEHSVIVQLSSSVAGHISRTELADDFDLAKPEGREKNDIVRVKVLEVDKPNKRVSLSARPSKVMSSTLPVEDPSITSLDQLKVNDVVRGFIKSVADIGLFVTLSDHITGFVRVSELSDQFVKDWKAEYQIDQLVKGKVIAVDKDANRIQLSLKQSVLSKDYVPLLTFHDMRKGMIVTGKIRKVEDFGAFIVVDNSHNVSGLCHRSQIAEKPVSDVRKLYKEGDVVKAIVLSTNATKRQISFGLRASYFSEDGDGALQSEENDLSGDEQDGVVLEDEDEVMEDDSEDDDDDEGILLTQTSIDDDADGGGLDAGGFSWSDPLTTAPSSTTITHTNDHSTSDSKKKKSRSSIQPDLTGDLDANGPQTADDFERLLLTSPDSSILWIQYMAFHFEQGSLAQARATADRALSMIPIAAQDEKLNVWTALLNLEQESGTAKDLDDSFERACRHADPQELHKRLASIYTRAGALDRADDLFKRMLLKPTGAAIKQLKQDPDVWLNYASFLFNEMASPTRARELLPRAMQSVPPAAQVPLTVKFAVREFTAKTGDPERGRTLFENLFATYPRRWDAWDAALEQERRAGELSKVRALFERMARAEGMKLRRARSVFERWARFEEGIEGGSVARVTRAEGEWMEKRRKKIEEREKEMEGEGGEMDVD